MILDISQDQVFECYFKNATDYSTFTYIFKIDSYFQAESTHLNEFFHTSNFNKVTVNKDFFVYGRDYLVSCDVYVND